MAEEKLLDLGVDSRPYNSFALEDARNRKNRRIGELAKACGVSTDTLRHYERKGVLKSGRSTNGYRRYGDEAFDRVRLVRKALEFGFTLDELGVVFKVRDHGGVPCRRVRELAAQKLATIESQLSEMFALRKELRSTLKDWDARLAHKDPTVPAGLLEALASSEPNPAHRLSGAALGKRSLLRTGVKS